MSRQLSNFLANKLVDNLFRGTAYSGPTHIWIALTTTTCVPSDTGTTLTGATGTGVEVTGTGYARQQLDPAGANWNNTQNSGTGVSSGTTATTKNSSSITFPTASSNWGTVSGFAICDAATNGNLLFFGNLTVARPVASGSLSFSATQLQIVLDS